MYWTDDYALFTIYQTSFAPARKPYRIGLMFTHKNSDFSAIFVRERSCTAPTLNEDLHISDTFVPLNWHSRTVAWTGPTKTEINIQKWGLSRSFRKPSQLMAPVRCSKCFSALFQFCAVTADTVQDRFSCRLGIV